MTDNTIQEQIHRLLRDHMLLVNNEKKFIPGVTPIQYAGAVYDHRELQAMTDVLLKGWFGLGSEGENLERELASYVGVKKAYLTNSGSSADLLALSSLMSYQFQDRLMPGDEVITPACTFPTVISAIIHCQLKLVFIDIEPETLNPYAESIEKAITKKTKLIFLVHTLGNPNDMDAIMAIAQKHHLHVIEDNCDALGSTYNGKKTGSFGILSAESFYPAHHMTTAGEGGAVFLNDMRLFRIVSSIREWGRACWCGASGGGVDGVCGARFKYNIDGVPYDHKYIFSHIGYNIKPVEIQAAMGRVQLQKVPEFIDIRKRNFLLFYDYFRKYEKFFILPKAMPKSDPSWFAFPLSIREDAPFDRFTITRYLEDGLIQTRPLFAGNILRQPAFKHINHRIVGSLKNSDAVFFRSFFIGIYPGITLQHASYIISVFEKFFQKYG